MMIKIDTKKCLGCGTCTYIAPKTFQMGKNGKAEVKNPGGDSEAKIAEAISSCPVGAIIRH